MEEPRESPAVLERWSTAAGVTLALRPLASDDGAREVRFLESLSPETRYERVFSHRGLLPGELRRLVRFDVRREIALAVVAGEGSEEQIVAVARLHNDAGEGPCEFGIVVGDAWQRQGIGARLLERLIALAQAAGVERVVGHTRATNEPLKQLCRRLGFSVSIAADDATVAQLAITLNQPPS